MVDYGIAKSENYSTIIAHLSDYQYYYILSYKKAHTTERGFRANGWTVVLAPEQLATWDVGDD